jgi:hypothetical protein
MLYTQEFALTWFLPVAIAFTLLLAVASFQPVARLVDSWWSVKLRESRWGIVGLLLSVAFFIFGVFLTILTMYFSPPEDNRSPVMLGFSIVLFIIGLFAFFFVIGLGLHYRKDSDDAPILSVTKTNVNIDGRYVTHENNTAVIRIPRYEIRIITLNDKSVNVGEIHERPKLRKRRK